MQRTLLLCSSSHVQGPLRGRQTWDDVVSEMLSLESVSGPMLKPFSALKVMGARHGQAFGAALLDFQRMAVTEDGAARLRKYHPGIAAWLQVGGAVGRWCGGGEARPTGTSSLQSRRGCPSSGRCS